MTFAFPVHVIHYQGAPERRGFMAGQLAAAGLSDVRFAERFDRRSLTAEMMAPWYQASEAKWKIMTSAMHPVLAENAQFHPAKKSWSEGVTYNVPMPAFRELTQAEIAATMEHFSVYEQVAGTEAALILEDDAVLAPDFAASLARNLAATPDDWDLIFLGSCCDLRVPHRKPDVAVYEMKPPRSKCADSYLIRGRAAKALLKALPFVQPIDWEMGYWMNRLGLKSYWWEPPLVTQGSQTGLFPSSLR